MNDPLKTKQMLMEEYQKRKHDKVKTAKEMGLTFEPSTFDHFREIEDYLDVDEITITFSYDEWYELWGEASGHLSYWGSESEIVDKLGEILDKYRHINEK